MFAHKHVYVVKRACLAVLIAALLASCGNGSQPDGAGPEAGPDSPQPAIQEPESEPEVIEDFQPDTDFQSEPKSQPAPPEELAEDLDEEKIAAFRRSIPYQWDLVSDYRMGGSTGFFEIDETAGRLEEYLTCFYASPARWRADEEIPDIQAENDLMFVAAAYNTRWYAPENPPWEDLVLYDKRVMLQEHIDRTARFLFGGDAEIDYASLENTDMYRYHPEYGIVSMDVYWVIQFHIPIVISYEGFGEYYEAVVVFPEASTHLPEGEYIYFFADGSGVSITQAEMAYYCYNVLPQYVIRLDKGPDGELYYVSCLAKG